MRMYRALLRAFPASFRAEYGEEMRAIFERRLSGAGGPGERAALRLRAILDVLPNALAAHWDILRQDVRYTVRSLSRSPGFAFTAVLIAALGVGAVTAAFSITDHVLFRALPFADADRLVLLWQDPSLLGTSELEPSPPNYRDWKRSGKSFEAMAAYHRLGANLVGGGEPQHLEGAAVDGDLLPMLGVRPLLGRVFTPEDHRPGSPGTLLLSEGAWKGRFGGDPGVVGRKVLLDEEPFTIVGVLSRSFQFPSRDAEMWAPMRLNEGDSNDRTNNYLYVVGKLKRGVSIQRARAEMRTIAAQLERAYPKENEHNGVTIDGLRDELSSQSRLLLWALLGASIGVLLIACTNLANLLLARALSRRRELAVRTAMGAGRERLVRQLLTESLLLAACGGALGIALAVAAVPLVARLVPNTLPIAEVPAVDLRMLVFAALLTGATGVGFGVVPALRGSGGDSSLGGLRDGARTGSDRRTERLRSALVVAEVTASVALLVASGLLLRALWRLQGVDPGFRPQSVLTLHTALPIPRYAPTQRRAQFYTRVLSDVRALPGVASASYISFLPMVMRGGIWSVTEDSRPDDPGRTRTASLRFVTPGFFETLGIPIRLGRDVRETDTHESPFVAVVSDSLVRRHWPGENPIGRRFRFGFHERTVVGVVGDIRVRGLERASEPQIYLSYQQADDGEIIGYVPKDLVIRAAQPGALLPALRGIIERADPQIPVSDVRLLTEIVRGETAPRRVQARVLLAFAAIAVLLAGIGIHGLLAFTVSQRTREIGVRVAMGARPGDILKMVMRQGVILAGVGVVLGVAVAYATGRAMQALLAGVSPADGMTFLCAVGLAVLMTIAGSLVPALRAARVDPMTAMRAE